MATLTAPASQAQIDDFLKECKPSANTGQKSDGGWYWVRLPEGAPTRTELLDTYVEEGQKINAATLKELERIKAEEPVRSNKKTGKRSQKEWREEAYAKLSKDVHDLAKNCGIITGKWLFRPKNESVDSLWSKIVHALATKDGPLAKLGTVHTAKVSAELEDGQDSYTVCVYSDDCFDKEAVGKVFKTLFNELQLESQSFKTCAYTHLSIDSKYGGSGDFRVSFHKPDEFIPKAERQTIIAARAEQGAKAVKAKTLEEELEDDGGFGGGGSDSDDDKPKKKKAKKV